MNQVLPRKAGEARNNIPTHTKSFNFTNKAKPTHFFAVRSSFLHIGHYPTEQPVPPRHASRLCRARHPRPGGVPLRRGGARPAPPAGHAARPQELVHGQVAGGAQRVAGSPKESSTSNPHASLLKHRHVLITTRRSDLSPFEKGENSFLRALLYCPRAALNSLSSLAIMEMRTVYYDTYCIVIYLLLLAFWLLVPLLLLVKLLLLFYSTPYPSVHRTSWSFDRSNMVFFDWSLQHGFHSIQQNTVYIQEYFHLCKACRTRHVESCTLVACQSRHSGAQQAQTSKAVVARARSKGL